MLNFGKINAFEQGQRESFEELICVLAKRQKPNGATEFQRIEGAGGDGGVEALWISSDGSKIGYQAKYFLNLKSSQWTQIDESVKRALEVHPELTRYIVALPINLTHKRQAKGTGGSLWEKWEARVDKWTEWANEKGLNVQFEPWTATDISELLLKDENQGLVQHWFNEQILGQNWFNKNFSTAKSLLDNRYSPSEHVQTSAEALFDTIARGSSTLVQIRECYAELRGAHLPTNFEKISHQPNPAEFDHAHQTYNDLLDTQNLFSADYNEEWQISAVTEALSAYREALGPLESALATASQTEDSEHEREYLNKISDELSNAYSAIDRLWLFVKSKNLQAERARYAIISGPAGAGKSHLLAHITDQRLSNKEPTVLLIGQSFSDANLWEQIGALLDIPQRTSSEILGLLSAAAERQGKRAVVMVDAINEGVGANYWRDRIAGLLEQVKEYPNLAFIFSCREEYLNFALPEAILKEASVFKVKGFQSNEEIEAAAKAYLDAKGISRPNTPWLSPEFRNPLFLKSTSEALHAKGEIEFPKGLHGISQLMSLYLDSLSMSTGLSNVDNDLLAAAIKRAVRAIAIKMVETGDDFVEFEAADQIAKEKFSQLPTPDNATWLSVLTRSSFLRRDPPPFDKDNDPFNPPQERIRFAFQRFQDHLMAQAIVERLNPDKLSAAFETDGELLFLFNERDTNSEFSIIYTGLIGALSTIYPEQFGVEFADTLPSEADLSSNNYILQEAFKTSCKWRRLDAFTDRSLELLVSSNEYYLDELALFVDVSMTIDHPWNAKFLHNWLIDQPMVERDSYWTHWVNRANARDDNQIDRLISWSNGSTPADSHHLELAGLVLSWFLTSSNRMIRDQASKALTSIFLRQSTVFPIILEKLAECNDPYLIERLYSSAFGACCLAPSAERLNSYSKVIWEKCFANGEPPIALRTRDYALGVIELAQAKKHLSTDVELDKCVPPFKSTPPQLNITMEEVEQLAKDCGSDLILRSASSTWGDFGKKTIPGRVRPFLTTPLSKPGPVSADEIKQRFIIEVVFPSNEKVAALEAFDETQGRRIFNPFRLTAGQDTEIKQKIEEPENNIIRARENFENLLSDEENLRFAKEYLREGQDLPGYKRIDVQQCRLWITKRAYELGWTSELFPQDGGSSYIPRHGNDLEGIGKKYQRIALDEITARFSDNFWCLNDRPEVPIKYRYSHQNFYRDIEPTVLPSLSRFKKNTDANEDWMIEPIIQLPEVLEEDLKAWPFLEDPTKRFNEKLLRTDHNGKRWRVLHEYNCERQDYPEPELGMHGARYEEFRFIYCAFVKSQDTNGFVEDLKERKSLDDSDFNPQKFTDGPFLLESYWRDTWHSEKFSEESGEDSPSYKYSNPVAHYYWESHLDKTLPEGFSVYLPQGWLAKDLDIELSKDSISSWLDNNGIEIVKVLKPTRDRSAVLIDEDALLQYCEKENLTPIWLLIGERNVWPKGDNHESCCRRSEGVWWEVKGQWKHQAWNDDTHR